MMPVFIAVAVLLWLIIGGIVALLVCPLLKGPAERRRTSRTTADDFQANPPAARTLLTIDKELR